MYKAIRKPSRIRAFTLIEILVVVAIIALLVSILMPALAQARAHARQKVCLNNLRECGKAMYQYAMDNDEVIPRGGNSQTAHWTMFSARTLGQIKSLGTTFDEDFEFYMNQLRVDKMEIFHCPERTASLDSPFLDYLVNAMDPRGPTDGEGQERDSWMQVIHTDDKHRDLSRLATYKRPAEVIYLADAEREDMSTSFAGKPTLKQGRANWKAGHQHWPSDPAAADTAWRSGGIDIMDVFLGGHLPQGRNYINTNDEPGPRRVARRLHLRRMTDAAFMDGHAVGVPLAEYDDDIMNYAYWLRLFGVKDPDAVAAADSDLE